MCVVSMCVCYLSVLSAAISPSPQHPNECLCACHSHISAVFVYLSVLLPSCNTLVAMLQLW